MENTLLLVSASRGRAELLTQAKIKFKVIGHRSDENIDQFGLTSEEIVRKIALDKLESSEIDLSMAEHGQLFALTADTLVFNDAGKSFGKPKDHEDAVAMLKEFARAPISVATGCCLRKFEVKNGRLEIAQTKIFSTLSKVQYTVSDDMINQYFSNEPHHMSAAGAACIEDFGAQFVQWISGSYSAIIGLPMFELRRELEEIGFFTPRS